MSYAMDRYPVDPQNGPAQFAELLRSLERRIADLEGKPLSGTFTSAGVDGMTFVYAGTLPDGDRGFLLRSEVHGWDLLRTTADDGITSPHLVGAPYDPSGPKVVTSGTFAAAWGILFGDALGAGVEIMIPFTTAASTTGEVRIVDNAAGTTSTETLPAATSGFKFVRYLHSFAIGSGPLDLRVEARRASGVGDVNVYPCHAWVRDPASCSSSGVWL